MAANNKYAPHVIVIPEDRADRQLANGFIGHFAVSPTAVEVRRPAGGWGHVLDVFEAEYVQHLRNCRNAHVVLLIDFDEKGQERRGVCEARIPDDLKPRTFLLGARITPEDLKRELNLTLEQIGFALAGECASQRWVIWGHDHLAHNQPELARLLPTLHPILFPGA